jgi:hypothetical protein
MLTSSKSDLGDGGASTDHEHQQQSDTVLQATARSGVIKSPQGGAHAIVYQGSRKEKKKKKSDGGRRQGRKTEDKHSSVKTKT